MTRRYLKRRFSNTKLEIGQNGIGNRICKQQKRISFYVIYKRKKKYYTYTWKWQIKCFVFITWFCLLDCQLLATCDTSYSGVVAYLILWHIFLLLLMKRTSWRTQPPAVYLTLLWMYQYLCVADRPHLTPYHSAITGCSVFEFLIAFEKKTRVSIV